MNEKIFYAILSLLIIVLSVGGYIFYQTAQELEMATSTPVQVVTATGTEGTTPSYTISTSTTLVSTDFTTLLSYANTEGEFAIQYPKVLSLIEPGATSTATEWSIGATSTGQLFASLYVGKEAQPQTNFSEGRMLIGASKDIRAVRDCTKVPSYARDVQTNVAINGRNFTTYSFSDAGAGNRYDITVYTTLYDKQCYSLSFFLRSGTIQNYPPESGIKEYDKQTIYSLFETIVKSFQII